MSSGGWGAGSSGQGGYPGGGYPGGPPPQQQPMPGGYGAPPPTGPPPSPSAMSIIGMVLGIVSWAFGFGPLTSLPGLIVSIIELRNIKRGASPQASKIFAQVGLWVSLANVVIAGLLILLWCGIFGFALIAEQAGR